MVKAKARPRPVVARPVKVKPPPSPVAVVPPAPPPAAPPVFTPTTAFFSPGAPTPMLLAPPSAAILPGRPMGERIAAYGQTPEARAKLDRLRGLGDEARRLEAEMERLADALRDAEAAMTPKDWSSNTRKANAKRDALRDMADRRLALRRDVARLRDAAPEGAARVLAVPEAERMAIDATGMADLDPALQSRAREAAGRLRSMVRHDGPLRVEWAPVPADAEQRAMCRDSDRDGRRSSRIRLMPDSGRETAAHELGHAIEYQVPGVAGAIQEFLGHRMGDEAFRPLATLFPDAGFGPHELGRKDRFDQFFGEQDAYYTGKYYADGSEVLSMGVQALFTDPAGFAEKDPEFATHILGLLDGRLRLR
jgi:hypothetical protein